MLTLDRVIALTKIDELEHASALLDGIVLAEAQLGNIAEGWMDLIDGDFIEEEYPSIDGIAAS